MVEFCRECRDEGYDAGEHRIVPADLILWGKFFPPEALGPRCLAHAREHMTCVCESCIVQWAVFDLRKVTTKLPPAPPEAQWA